MIKYGEFSSLVQLGVSIHVGTALLQIYGEIGLRPIRTKLERVRAICVEIVGPNKDDIESSIIDIESHFDEFSEILFASYKWYIIFNALFATFLALNLVIMSFVFDMELNENYAVMLAGASVLPAPLSLLVLWINASIQSSEIYRRADALEKRLLDALRGQGQVRRKSRSA